MREDVAKGLDNYLFIKNGYSFWKHIAPFIITTALLAIVSLSPDDMIFSIVNRLSTLDAGWLVFVPFTAGLTFIYYRTIREQVKKAYLWQKATRRRTILTCLVYLALCTAFAHVVLSTNVSGLATTINVGTVWSSYLITVLSPLGLGWSRPDIAASMNSEIPDYTAGHRSAHQITEVLQRVRHQPRGTKQDVEEFLEAVTSLDESMNTNLAVEPNWARPELQQAQSTLKTLADQVEERFPAEDDSAVESFAEACKCQAEFRNQQFINTLTSLSVYWPEWRCPPGN